MIASQRNRRPPHRQFIKKNKMHGKLLIFLASKMWLLLYFLSAKSITCAFYRWAFLCWNKRSLIIFYAVWHTLGHKLKQRRFHLNTFPYKHGFPSDVMEFLSMEIFRSCLDTALHHQLLAALLEQGRGPNDLWRYHPTSVILWFQGFYLPAKFHQVVRFKTNGKVHYGGEGSMYLLKYLV